MKFVNENLLRSALTNLPIPDIHYFDTIGSTNDAALKWADEGAPDGALVVSNTQSAGRGRLNRRWITNPDAALAFSLILHPPERQLAIPALYSPLGALAVKETLISKYGLVAKIKWPNDVLINRKKAAGILVETIWLGSHLQVIVLGIGVNVTLEAIPTSNQLRFPATNIEQETGLKIDRISLLVSILQEIWHWRYLTCTQEFIHSWEDSLAFLHERVIISNPITDEPPLKGILMGVDRDGNLRLQTRDGVEHKIAVGEVNLRPAGD
jgi:BirA family transcriptional regulator, biotin operon repressor / biotin---[acetyl-CoA-carboxylase] ligase